MSQLDAAIGAGIESRLEALHEWRRTALSGRALRWLALLPEWTDSLADACEFPTEIRLEEFLDVAERARYCEVRHVTGFDGGETVRFWMPDEERESLISEWLRQPHPGLQQEVAEISRRLIEAHAVGKPMSRSVLRWARLASEELEGRVVLGDALTRWVGLSLGKGDIDIALNWIYAGESLAEALGARVELVAARARRRLNLHYRRIFDEETLKDFIQREEQIEELHELVTSEDKWAVHFMGPGGTGKTMLMRFVTSRLPDNPFACASRVDFDYVDPSVLLESPATFLRELGEGLAIDPGDGAREALFDSFLEAVTEAEEARTGPGRGAMQPIEMPEFERAVEAFALFLQELPKPVVLVLDTCEELAKFHPPGGTMPSIDAMFEILERIQDAARRVHDSDPEVRAIIAGRRWLTSKYADRPERGPDAPEEVLNLPPRDYLGLHSVRGFTGDEVETYFRDVQGHDLDPEMLVAVCDATLDEGESPGVEGGSRGDESRYNPIDVALVGRWLKDEPNLAPAALAEGNFDGYVERRIVDRLKDEPMILAALPFVTVLGSFDAATIEPVLGSDRATRKHVLAGLIAEDWTHLEGGPDAERMVIKVDPGLLPRLRSYYDGDPERRARLEAAREALQEHLAKMLEKPPRATTIEAVVAALRLLPEEKAVRGFDRLADRVAREPAWIWAEALCERLLADEELGEGLLASVWALYLSALTHREAEVDRAPYWRAVTEMASGHPDRDQANVLAVRGSLGALAAEAARGKADELEARKALSKGRLLLDRPGGEVVASALLAAAEALIDSRERGGPAIPVEVVSVCLGRLLEEFDGDKMLQRYVYALAGRMGMAEGDDVVARGAFTRVERAPLHGGKVEPLFADWAAPASVQHRATLELLRFRLMRREERETLLSRCEEEAFEQFGGVDAAQLLSLTLQARLARGPVSEERLERVAAHEELLGSYRLTAPAHRYAPPLYVSLAEAWLAIGRADRALELLTERERVATAQRAGEQVTRVVTRALVRTVSRLRLRERLALVSHSTGGDAELRADALAAGALIAGLQSPRKGGHASWRARILLESVEEDDLPPASPPEEDEDPSPATILHHALDRLESELVLQRINRVRGQPPGVRRAAEAVRAEIRHRGAARLTAVDDLFGVEWLRVDLRLSALLGWEVASPPGRARQVAQLALEEGELLALRIPDRALPLLTLAQRHFVAAGDHYGEFMACLLAAIAEIHAGRFADARRRERQVLDCYATLLRDNDRLPPPWRLEDPEQARAEIPRDEPWRAWVWRLAYYLQWRDGNYGGAEAERAASAFGPEFALAPVRGVTPRRSALRRRLSADIPAALEWVSTIVVVLAVLIGLTLLAGPLAPLGVFVAGGVAFFTVEGIGPRLRRRILPLSAFDVRLLAPLRAEGESAAFAVVLVEPWSRIPPMRVYLRTVSRLRTLAQRRARRAEIVSLGDSPLPPSDPVAQAFRPRLNGGHLPLRLKVDAALAQHPWERRLTAHLSSRRDWRPEDSPPLRRIRPTGFAPRPEAWPQQISGACSARWRQFLEDSAGREVKWLADLGLGGGTRSSEEEPLPSWRHPRGGARATISLGTPVSTRAGWRLRLDKEEISPQRETPPEPRMQQLVSPDRLVREAPVVVIVGQPDGHSLTLNQRVSNGLRSLGNEALLAGAHAVVTVPVLPPERATEAIELLAEEIESWERPPDGERLQATVTRLQALVYGNPRDEGEKERLLRVELALDVCLFAPS